MESVAPFSRYGSRGQRMPIVRPMAAGFLALWLVLLSGVVYPQLAGHAAKHAHHNAATHTTALCSWLCIAADSVASPYVEFSPAERAVPMLRALFEAGTYLLAFPLPPVRAPPAASL